LAFAILREAHEDIQIGELGEMKWSYTHNFLSTQLETR
jgi:hypothetical protein